MPLIINTNVTSMTAQRHLNINTTGLQKTMERLASGYRINRASDDAAGLQLSEALRAQIRGSKKALDNAQDGLNVLNIADGALQTITDNIQRMRELAIQAANDTYATAQRSSIQREVQQLMADVDRIASSTKFNGVELLSSSAPANFILQIGPNATTGVSTTDTIDIASAMGDSTASAGLGLIYWDSTTGSLVSGAASYLFDTSTNIGGFVSALDSALSVVNIKRGNLGAFVNRLEGTMNNLSISIENLSASESRIRNVDVAAESANLTRNQILQQAASTILSQANQAPTLALQLLQGGG